MIQKTNKIHAYSYTWTVMNLAVCPIKPGKRLCSPPFLAENMGNTKWRLVFFPKGKTNPEYMSLYLQRKTDGSELKEVAIDFKISMLSIDSRFRRMRVSRNVCFKENEFVGFSEFARWDLPEVVDRVPPYAEFVIRVELSPSDRMVNDYRWNQRVDLKALSLDLTRLFDSGMHSDFVLSSRGVEFRVHKAVLTSRSPRFKRDLRLQGNCTGKDMSDVPPDVLWDFLCFLYSGTLEFPRNGTQLAILAAVAEEFEVEDLLKRIRTFPKSYVARTILQREHKYLTWCSKVLSSGDSDYLSYRRAVKCDLIYCDKLFICCQVVHDEGRGDGSYINASFALSGIHPECPVFLLATVHLVTNESSSSPPHSILELYEGHHVFESGAAWHQTFPIEDVPLDIGVELTLGFQIDLCDGTNTSIVHEEDVTFPNRCPIGLDNFNHFSRNFKTLLTSSLDVRPSSPNLSPNFTDFTIFCGEETYPVHQAILSFRSPVFEKMLEHDMIEKRTGTVIIEDVSPSVMWSMLSYIYSGVLKDIGHQEVCDLYQVSDKYALFVLQERCHSLMVRNLNINNVLDVLDLAQLHCDRRLECTARKYIRAHGIEVEGVSPAELPMDLTSNNEDENRQFVTV